MFMSIKNKCKLIVKKINFGQKTTRQPLSPVDLRDLRARLPARGRGGGRAAAQEEEAGWKALVRAVLVGLTLVPGHVLQNGAHLLRRDTGEPLDEVMQRRVVFEVLEER